MKTYAQMEEQLPHLLTKKENADFLILIGNLFREFRQKRVGIRVLLWGRNEVYDYLIQKQMTKDDYLLVIGDKTVAHTPDGSAIGDQSDLVKNEDLNVEHYRLVCQQPYGESQNFSTFPIRKFLESGAFDIIINAGRNRAECSAVAALIGAEDAVQIIFNPERVNYQTSNYLWIDVNFNVYDKENARPEHCDFVEARRPRFTIKQRGETVDVPIEKLPAPQVVVQAPPVVEEDRNEIDFGVCAVTILRETFPFIEDWLKHYTELGASKITIYDNTGSLGSKRKNTVFYTGQMQLHKLSKRGEPYGAFTASKTDEDIRKEVEAIVARYPKAKLETWAPKDENGIQYHGQVEAYVKFLQECKRERITWAWCCDIDELLVPKKGMNLLLVNAVNKGIKAIQVRPVLFTARWNNGQPFTLEEANEFGWKATNFGAEKTLVRVDAVKGANIHLGWKIDGKVVLGDPEEILFKHYQDPSVQNMKKRNLKLFATNKTDLDKMFGKPLPMDENVEPLPVQYE